MATGQVFVCQGRPRLVVDVTTGSLFLRGWDDDVVKVEKRSGLTVSQIGNKILLKSEENNCECKVYLPRKSDVFIDGTILDINLAGIDGRGRIDFTGGVLVGDSWRGSLEIDCCGANVQLCNSQGTISVDSTNGDVEIQACQGEFSCDTGAGAVTVSDSSGSVSADTGRGPVAVSSFSGPAHIDTGSGSVSLEQVYGRNVRVFCGGGSIKAALPGPVPGRWELATRSGDIELSVPENISAYFELRGRRLTVEDLNIDYNSQGTNRLSGALGGGEGKITAHSYSGKIVARKVAASVATNKWQVQDEEALKILRMLEQGAITIDEADLLLAALNGDEPRTPETRGYPASKED